MIPSRLVLATGNPGKVEELGELAREWGTVEVLSLDVFPHVRLPPETGTTYAENALAKAQAVAAATSLPALGDDSGLEVAALDGAPGLFSARYGATDGERIARLLAALAEVRDAERGARFRAVVALAWPDGRSLTGEGAVGGRIAGAPRGVGGFGFDPVFLVEELGCTFAEATRDEKRRTSHRARAMRALGATLARA